MPCDNEGRGWIDASVNQQLPEVANKHQKPGAAKEGSPAHSRNAMAMLSS